MIDAEKNFGRSLLKGILDDLYLNKRIFNDHWFSIIKWILEDHCLNMLKSILEDPRIMA